MTILIIVMGVAGLCAFASVLAMAMLDDEHDEHEDGWGV